MKKRLISFILSLVMCAAAFSGASLAARDLSYEESLAADLKELGIFKGVSDTDFDLGRAPTRVEALVMLLRVLGREDEVKAGSWKHPFTDVPKWADKYVGYAYEKGLTKGVSKTLFGDTDAEAYTYLTFMLRALGYSDTNGKDFTWNDPFTLAKKLGVLPDKADVKNFLRADAVLVTYAALHANMKGTNTLLAKNLISDGAFSQEKYESCYRLSELASLGVRRELNAQEVYAACNPAVFQIKTYMRSGIDYAQGSGFFIDASGIAVTNCHVLENAASATATTTDGAVHRIIGILYWNEEADYAVIKVEGEGFAALKMGDSDEVAGGERVYALGNPQGLTSTISDGIVSNPRRADLGNMIQVTAPISPGSSGGALINRFGEVIGITTGSIESGQSLNFCVPINAAMTGEDITEYEARHGLVYTFGGSGEPASGSRKSQSAAFYALGDWVKKNCTDTLHGDPMYLVNTILAANSYQNFALIYTEDDKTVTLVNEAYYNGSAATAMISLTPDGGEYFAAFFFEVLSYGVEYSAGGYIEPEKLAAGESVSFEFSDFPSALENVDQLACTMYCDAALFLDAILASFSDYGAGDFGFNASKLS